MHLQPVVNTLFPGRSLRTWNQGRKDFFLANLQSLCVAILGRPLKLDWGLVESMPVSRFMDPRSGHVIAGSQGRTIRYLLASDRSREIRMGERLESIRDHVTFFTVSHVLGNRALDVLKITVHSVG